MFEPISQSLYEIMMFSILGCFLAALYEPLRIIRLFIKTGAVVAGIQDFLFLTVCGLIVFSYSLEFGDGYFRYFYILGVVFGVTVYFLTAGRIISYVARTFSEAIKNAVKCVTRFIYRRFVLPLWKTLVNIAQIVERKSAKIYKIAEKRSMVLKNTAQIKYNSIKLKKQVQKSASEKSKTLSRIYGIQENEHGIEKSAKAAIRARVRLAGDKSD